MTKRVGRIDLRVDDQAAKVIPLIRTHAGWCSWLFTRGSLKPEHKPCMASNHCVASAQRSDNLPEWRKQRHVSR